MAICHWVGGAPAVVDVWDLTVANTWAAADTATITIGTKDLVITSGSSTIATIVTEIIASINATSFDDPTPPASFSRTTGGQAIPEFTEVFAEAHPTNTAIVRIKARQAGVPIGLTCSEVTAGTGTITASNSTVATGPNFLSNADNYLAGALPVDNDTLYFDTGAVDALYALTYFRANNVDLTMYISNDWTGQLGLPAVNAKSGYNEYRQRYFQARGLGSSLHVIPGVLGNASCGLLWIDCQEQIGMSISVFTARKSGVAPSIFIAGSTQADFLGAVIIEKGNVYLEPDDAPTATTKYMTMTSLMIGRPNGSENDATVIIGRNAFGYLFGTITLQSGRLINYSKTLLAGDVCPLYIKGGVCEWRGTGVHHTVDIYAGGVFYPMGFGTNNIGKIQIFGGTLDCRQCTDAQASTNVDLYAGGSVYDPNGLVTSEIDLFTTLDKVVLQLPPNRKLVFSAAAA